MAETIEPALHPRRVEEGVTVYASGPATLQGFLCAVRTFPRWPSRKAWRFWLMQARRGAALYTETHITDFNPRTGAVTGQRTVKSGHCNAWLKKEG